MSPFSCLRLQRVAFPVVSKWCQEHVFSDVSKFSRLPPHPPGRRRWPHLGSSPFPLPTPPSTPPPPCGNVPRSGTVRAASFRKAPRDCRWLRAAPRQPPTAAQPYGPDRVRRPPPP